MHFNLVFYAYMYIWDKVGNWIFYFLHKYSNRIIKYYHWLSTKSKTGLGLIMWITRLLKKNYHKTLDIVWKQVVVWMQWQ